LILAETQAAIWRLVMTDPISKCFLGMDGYNTGDGTNDFMP
jgi:hypothetical protein